MTTNKITAKQLVEMLAAGEQLPTCGTIDDDFPDTNFEVYRLVEDYWAAVDHVKDVKWGIKHLAEHEESE